MPSSEAIKQDTHLKRVYHDANGVIVGWDINNGLVRQGFDHIEIDDERAQLDIDPATHKVVNGALVEMTDAEKRIAQQPTLHDISCHRTSELYDTDWRERFPDWAAYRQALRDITTHGDAVAMVKAWPVRPDGTDSIKHFRTRI